MTSRLKFKQVAVASAASASMMLGLATNSHAITLGEPGSALLVPYVLCDTTDPGNGTNLMNTMIGVTTSTASVTTGGPFLPTTNQPFEATTIFDYSTFVGVSGIPSQVPTVDIPDDYYVYQKHFSPRNAVIGKKPNPDRVIEWFFFDQTSKKIMSGKIPATANDFVPIDWCAQSGGDPRIDGVVGYMILADDDGRFNDGSDFAMWGTAYLINNGWNSMAYIPVLPMNDGGGAFNPEGYGEYCEDYVPGGTGHDYCINEVYWVDREPVVNVPWHSGIKMTNYYDDGETGDDYVMALRYFLDPSLAYANEFVFWFSENCTGGKHPSGNGNLCDRRAVHSETYDEEEMFCNNFVTDLSKELNIYKFMADDDSNWFPGMSDRRRVTCGTAASAAQAANSGIAYFWVPEGNLHYGYDGYPYSAAVAFTLMFVNAFDNPNQVQTELAQERGFEY